MRVVRLELVALGKQRFYTMLRNISPKVKLLGEILGYYLYYFLTIRTSEWSQRYVKWGNWNEEGWFSTTLTKKDNLKSFTLICTYFQSRICFLWTRRHLQYRDDEKSNYIEQSNKERIHIRGMLVRLSGVGQSRMVSSNFNF